MKLNRVERALMNNPVRAFLQRHYEAPLFERLGGLVRGGRVLEIGCGRGVGIEIIVQRFGAREVQAFDLDPDMVEKAGRRLSSYPPSRFKIHVGDATAIDAKDECFDAVFDFGVIHHVPDWRKAVSEVARVLRRGGRFFFEEVTGHALQRWMYRTFLVHPTADRFGSQEFVDELERKGIRVDNNVVERCFGDFVIGVGRRDGSPILRSAGK